MKCCVLMHCSLTYNPYCCWLPSPAHLYIPELFTHCLPTIICVTLMSTTYVLLNNYVMYIFCVIFFALHVLFLYYVVISFLILLSKIIWSFLTFLGMKYIIQYIELVFANVFIVLSPLSWIFCVRLILHLTYFWQTVS